MDKGWTRQKEKKEMRAEGGQKGRGEERKGQEGGRGPERRKEEKGRESRRVGVMLYIVVIVDLICKGNGELEIVTLRGSINYYYYLIRVCLPIHIEPG